jgi:hypothetical protein
MERSAQQFQNAERSMQESLEPDSNLIVERHRHSEKHSHKSLQLERECKLMKVMNNGERSTEESLEPEETHSPQTTPKQSPRHLNERKPMKVTNFHKMQIVQYAKGEN